MEQLGFFGLALLMAGLSAVYVLYPLTKTKRHLFEESGEQVDGTTGPGLQRELVEAQVQRDDVYDQLWELDQDFAAGDLELTDYQQLRAASKQQAVAVLVYLDQLKTHQQHLADEIEGEIEATKIRVLAQSKAGKLKVKANTSVTTNPSPYSIIPKSQPQAEFDERYCERCGYKAGFSAVYCTKCGTRLPAVAD